ncbi:MAG TPA: RNA 2',3'-cyclic phosphodiesterase [Caulobacteraceae bacterium]|nr:RNA 2',3'-cyclic phosphodiesterase [Caulobacteraceae bacterium]
MIRLFAAIAIPDHIAQALAPLQSGVDGARWRPAEAFHITLRFVGDVAEDIADSVDEQLSGICAKPFDLALGGVGAFGEGRDLRAIWAGVQESEPLRRLAGKCESAVRRAGLKPETRNYAPHVTLAYLRGAGGGEIGAWIASHNLLRTAPFRVDSFGLYSSWTGKAGASYRLEQSYTLA